MKAPHEKPEVQLTGKDDNAYAIMASVAKALRNAGADGEFVSKYQKEAMSGDYDNLLRVSMEYADVS